MQKKTMKEIYEMPQTRVFEVKIQGIICLSGEVGATMNTEWEEETI